MNVPLLIYHTDVNIKKLLAVAHLRHEDPEGTFGLDDACDAINALFQTALAICDENFLLKVGYLGVSVGIQITLRILIIPALRYKISSVCPVDIFC